MTKSIVTKTVLVVLLVFCTLLFSQDVFAATIHVDETDCNDVDGFPNFCTITAAIGYATTGDHIYVHAGTYDGNVSVNKSLHILGATSNAVIVDGGATTVVFSITTPGLTVELENLTIQNGVGSGISATAATTLTISNSTIRNNSATFGGGLIVTNVGSTTTISNSTFSGNSATNGGGAIKNGGTMTIVNSTIAENNSDSDAGDITDTGSDGGAVYNTSMLTIKNTIIANNTGVASKSPDCFGDIASTGYNIVGNEENNCDVDAAVGDQLGTIDNPINPLLGALADNGGSTQTYALLTGSPAIDAIPSTSCTLDEDQRGYDRPAVADQNCDIGAYEAGICGDSAVDYNETCDDGNVTDGDGCSDVCQLESCGNGFVDPGEACDDGDADDTDGCKSTCTLPVCGDDITNGVEECDDGNTTNGDGCNASCEIVVCGNDSDDPGEECDDGNTVSWDGCSATCELESCGDGVLDTGEVCDDGNSVAGD
ncbi:MAG TPA: choice-of-anchor Q domain-containing protein, partial [bacterium]|nr:choice-of-anchor Q domain-containing protein [bacterium]